jgi:hypothetical protein
MNNAVVTTLPGVPNVECTITQFLESFVVDDEDKSADDVSSV